MKQLEKCSGRGFDSRHLHLIVFGYIVQVGHANSEFVKYEVDSRYIHHFKMVEQRKQLVGGVLVSTGQQVQKWTTHQSRC